MAAHSPVQMNEGDVRREIPDGVASGPYLRRAHDSFVDGDVLRLDAVATGVSLSENVDEIRIVGKAGGVIVHVMAIP